MHIHILGIGGTFMSGLALIARAMGHTVTGVDAACYPPISDLLDNQGIRWEPGYEPNADMQAADLVIVGNAMKRGVPAVEWMLNARKLYTSGPDWLGREVLAKRRVMAISGTHGKTTTTSMLAHILETAGYRPGFLIGGVAQNFGINARLGDGEWFVIEADEYDSAFFDKRPKCLHYRPELAIINNIEFDHADIYADLAAIQKQFHYFIRTIPGDGLLLTPYADLHIETVLKKGLYTPRQTVSLADNPDWSARLLQQDASVFQVLYHEQVVAEVEWGLIGGFNVENALMAFAAAAYAGLKAGEIAKALQTFMPVKRRLELRGKPKDIAVFDDFAHHPTAIRRTIEALRANTAYERVIAVVEFGSNSMRAGTHLDAIPEALGQADMCFIKTPDNPEFLAHAKDWLFPNYQARDTDTLLEAIAQFAKPNDAIVIMSNKAFDGAHEKLLAILGR